MATKRKCTSRSGREEDRGDEEEPEKECRSPRRTQNAVQRQAKSDQRKTATNRNKSSSSDDDGSENRDPFSDCDGDFGSDKNYEPPAADSDSSDCEIFSKRAMSRLLNLGRSAYRRQTSESDSGERSSLKSDVTEETSTHAVRDGNSHENSDSDCTFIENTDDDAGERSEINKYTTGDDDTDQTEHDCRPENQRDGISNHSDITTNSVNVLLAATSPNSRLVRPGTPTNEDEWVDTTDDIPDFFFDSTLTGPTCEIDENSTVMDTFKLIMNDNLIDYLVECTNAYGAKLCNNNRPHTRHSRNKTFKLTTPEEMKKFLGLSFLHGHIKIPVARKLFTHDDPLYYHPIFSYVMSGRRYTQLLRCFCAAEFDAKGKDKVNKFADALTQVFRDVLQPGINLSLDESLLLFRGRLHFRQYIKSKKARYGIKFYVLTTDDGYILNLLMYCGSDDVTDADGEPGKKVDKLVLRLMRPYLLKGHHLFMDNFYNSVTLSQKLLELKTHTNGTLRSNRKDNPKVLTERKLKKGEHFWLRKKKVYVSKWKDKRPVLVLTTREHPQMIEVQNRHGRKSMKPREVASYNAHMSGIDRSDQMMSYYSTPRKTIRWYKKVLFHLFDMALWNSYYLYKKYVKKEEKYEFVTYRDEVIKCLLMLPKNLKGKDIVNRNKNDNRLHGNQQDRQAKVIPNNSGHWPVRIEGPPSGKKKFSFLACKVCTKKKIRRETSYRCEGCPETPALCPTCFKEWHDNYADYVNP